MSLQTLFVIKFWNIWNVFIYNAFQRNKTVLLNIFWKFLVKYPVGNISRLTCKTIKIPYTHIIYLYKSLCLIFSIQKPLNIVKIIFFKLFETHYSNTDYAMIMENSSQLHRKNLTIKRSKLFDLLRIYEK